MANYTLYRVRATTLTPLHIGSGRDLLHEYDYAIHQGRTWRINEDTLLESQDIDDPHLADQLANTPPAQLLRPADFKPDSKLFRYIIRGTPRSKSSGAQVRELLKDPYDRPYLPGSSLKGALRTALGWIRWDQKKLRPDPARLGRRPKFAARWYEEELFAIHGGKAPNYDLLRALQVSDSAPVGPDSLLLVNARVLSRSGKLGSPIELEAVKPGVTFELTIKVDEALFSDWAQRHRLKLQGAALLHQLPKAVRIYTGERLKAERAWFEAIQNGKDLAAYYRELLRSLAAAQKAGNACLIQVGWGGGWESKTFGSRLQEDPQFMTRLIGRLRRGRAKPDTPFPSSRRALVQIRRGPDGRPLEVPRAPLGWLRLEFQRVR